MQNFNAPPGQSGVGAPPPAKKGMSKGCLIGIIAAVVLAIGLVVLLVLGGVGAYWISQRASETSNFNISTGASGSSGSTTTTTTTGSADDAEGPQPTAAQTAAISGGQSAAWPQQEMSWTVPQRWRQQTADSRTFHWMSPDFASLIVSISPMSADFPSDISLAAFYDQAKTRKENGEVDEYQYLKLGGVKGVMFRESAPEDTDGPQRLQWLGYREYKGQKQMINIMLATKGRDFARQEDTMRGILYSTKF